MDQEMLLQQLQQLEIPAEYKIKAFILLSIILILKGFALWRAAKKNDKFWFWVFVVTNILTYGTIEAVYLIIDWIKNKNADKS